MTESLHTFKDPPFPVLGFRSMCGGSSLRHARGALPFLRRSLEHDTLGEALMKDLTKASLESFRNYASWSSSSSASSHKNLNNCFFERQRLQNYQHGSLDDRIMAPLRRVLKSREGQVLERSVTLTAADLLESWRHRDLAHSLRADDDWTVTTDIWAAVGGLQEGTELGHEVHTHDTALVSGALYLSVPNNAGSLVLGSGEHVQVVMPSVGDIVAFAGWVPHHVEPTALMTNDTPRVALAFNVSKRAVHLRRDSWLRSM